MSDAGRSGSSGDGSVLRCRVCSEGRADYTGTLDRIFWMGKSGRRCGKLEERTCHRLRREGQRRGLVTRPLISKHCQISRLRCQRSWIRGWGSVEGRAGNVKAVVDNVQIEMPFKVSSKWRAVSVTQWGQMAEAGQLPVGTALLQLTVALAEDSVLTLATLSIYR